MYPGQGSTPFACTRPKDVHMQCLGLKTVALAAVINKSKALIRPWHERRPRHFIHLQENLVRQRLESTTELLDLSFQQVLPNGIAEDSFTGSMLLGFQPR